MMSTRKPGAERQTRPVDGSVDIELLVRETTYYDFDIADRQREIPGMDEWLQLMSQRAGVELMRRNQRSVNRATG